MCENGKFMEEEDVANRDGERMSACVVARDRAHTQPRVSVSRVFIAIIHVTVSICLSTE